MSSSQSREIERAYDVHAHTELPDWLVLPGVASVGAAEPRDLDARYYDTHDVALGRAGYAVRRRSGGPDAGWHIKGPREHDGARRETHWELTDDLTVPAEVVAALSAVTGEPLHPLARIRNARVAFALRDAAGELVAEVVDDHVRARDERRGVEQSWREWEVELGPAGPQTLEAQAAFFEEVDALVISAGGRIAASDSKLARTLGF